MIEDTLKDNVIKFPEADKPKEIEVAPAVGTGFDDLQEKVDKGTPHVIDLIDKNLKKGLAGLEKKLDTLDGLSDDKLVSIDSATVGGLKSAYITLEALNSLVGMMRHDLISAIQNLEQQAKGQWMSSAHVQTLIELLQEKEVITEDELKATWAKLVEENVPKKDTSEKQ